MVLEPAEVEKLIAEKEAEELTKLDKYILSIRASDYVKSVGKSLKDFELVGVDVIKGGVLFRYVIHDAKNSCMKRGRNWELK